MSIPKVVKMKIAYSIADYCINLLFLENCGKSYRIEFLPIPSKNKKIIVGSRKWSENLLLPSMSRNMGVFCRGEPRWVRTKSKIVPEVHLRDQINSNRIYLLNTSSSKIPRDEEKKDTR